MYKYTYSPLSILFSKIVNLFYVYNANAENVVLQTYKSYSLIKTISLKSLITGLYQNTKKNKVIIKYSSTSLNTFDVVCLKQDYNLSKIIKLSLPKTQNTNYQYSIPKNISFNIHKNRVVFVKEYVLGKSVSKLATHNIEIIFRELFPLIEIVSRKITSSKEMYLPKRGYFFTFFVSFYYIVRICFNNFELICKYKNLLIFMYIEYFRDMIKRKEYILAHRDLHVDNLVVNNKLVYILDFESCVLSEKNTDLAISMRYLLNILTNTAITNIINSSVAKSEKNSFIRLSIFYTLQLLALSKKSTYHYQQAESYLEFILNNLIAKQYRKN